MKNHSKYRWKKFAVATTFALVSMVSVTSSLASTAVNEDRVYYVYDAETGNYLRNYTLYEVNTLNNTSSSSTRAIYTESSPIEMDWSNIGVGEIEIPTSSSLVVGSCIVIDSHTIATAAHCVYGYSDININFYDEDGNKTLTVSAVEYHVPQLFVKSYDAGLNYDTRMAYDYALITVEEDLSDYCTFNLGTLLDSYVESGDSVSVTGFPANSDALNSADFSSVYRKKATSSGAITTVTDVAYDDTQLVAVLASGTGGDSGGAVYVTETFDGKRYCTLVGIFISERVDGSYNSAVRFSTIHLQFYLNNSNLSY